MAKSSEELEAERKYQERLAKKIAKMQAQQVQDKKAEREAEKLKLAEEKAVAGGLDSGSASKKAIAERKIADNEVANVVAGLTKIADGDGLPDKVASFLKNNALFEGDAAIKNKQAASDLKEGLDGVLGSEDLVAELTHKVEAKISASKLESSMKALTDKAASLTTAEHDMMTNTEFLKFAGFLLNIALKNAGDVTVAQLLKYTLGIKLDGGAAFEGLEAFAFVDAGGKTIEGATHDNAKCIGQMAKVMEFAIDHAVEVC